MAQEKKNEKPIKEPSLLGRILGIPEEEKSPEKQSPQDEIGIIGIKPKEESEIPIREGGAGYFAPSFAFSDIEGKDKKGLVDAERHLQVDILSLPSIRRIIQYPEGTDIDPRRIRPLTENDVVDISDKAARLLGIIYGSQGQQLLQRATTFDLLVQLRQAGVEIDPRQIRALTSADVVTIANQILRDADGHGQVDVLTIPTDRVITDITKVSTRKYLAPTSLAAGGTATVWTPATGKAIRLKFFSITTNAATLITLREGTTDWIAFYLPANGVVAVNLIGTNIQFAANNSLVVYSSAAATVSVTAMGDEV